LSQPVELLVEPVALEDDLGEKPGQSTNQILSVHPVFLVEVPNTAARRTMTSREARISSEDVFAPRGSDGKVPTSSAIDEEIIAMFSRWNLDEKVDAGRVPSVPVTGELTGNSNVEFGEKQIIGNECRRCPHRRSLARSRFRR
jgi:hypothetical protein